MKCLSISRLLKITRWLVVAGLVVSFVLVMTHPARAASAGTPATLLQSGDSQGFDLLEPSGFALVVPYILVALGSAVIGVGVWYYLKPEGPPTPPKAPNGNVSWWQRLLGGMF